MNGVPTSPLDLKELGWLSPEQERLVESRLQQQHQQSAVVVDAQYRYLSNSNTTCTSSGAAVTVDTTSTVAATVGVETDSKQVEQGYTEGGDNTTTATSTSTAATAVPTAFKETVESYTSTTTGSSTSINTTSNTTATTTNTTSSMSMSMFSGAMSLLSGGSSNSGSCSTKHTHQSTEHQQSPTITTTNNTNPTTTTTTTTTTKRPAKGIMSSMFLSVPNTTDNVEFEDTGTTEIDDPERLPSSMRLNCLRCTGTVEGPKYSTCTCTIPALVPEDLATTTSSSTSSSGWGFSGMFSKSSSVFKESLAKASQVTASNVEGLMSMTKAATTTASSSSAGAENSNVETTKTKNTEGYSYYSTVVSGPAATGSTRNTAATTTATATTDNTTTTGTTTVEPEHSTESIISDSHTPLPPPSLTAAVVAPEKELWDFFNESAPPVVSQHSGDDNSETELPAELESVKSECVTSACVDVNTVTETAAVVEETVVVDRLAVQAPTEVTVPLVPEQNIDTAIV